jgi:hypothetical protein
MSDSPHWTGPTLYDSINVYSVVTERNGVHRAMTRLTGGYTVNNGAPDYALTMKVLPTNGESGQTIGLANCGHFPVPG